MIELETGRGDGDEVGFECIDGCVAGVEVEAGVLSLGVGLEVVMMFEAVLKMGRVMEVEVVLKFEVGDIRGVTGVEVGVTMEMRLVVMVDLVLVVSG